jgi:two-component system phosphate regulon response regulator PhoB
VALKAKILVVDDEPDALELVGFNLKKAGFEVLTASDGTQAMRKARELLPNLIVLDIMLPEMDGLDVCRLLRADRQTSGIPIILLTARAAEIDRVLGLELGADDYLTKPFSPRELILRIRNVLGRRLEPNPDVIRVGDLMIDSTRFEVMVRGRRIDLTATEFRLVSLLAERRGRVQSREQLLRDVWQYDSLIDTRTVDTHVRRLREKLGPAADLIETVRGVGYRMMDR